MPSGRPSGAQGPLGPPSRIAEPLARWRGRPRGAEGLIDPVAGSLAREPAPGGGIGITGPSGSGTNTYGASDGQGIGGGAYVVGTFSEDSSTVVTKSHAFTNHDNIGP